VAVLTGLQCRCVRVGQGFGGLSLPAREGLLLDWNTPIGRVFFVILPLVIVNEVTVSACF
jgi:hypothetical protein